jgi:predicted phage tail protein
MGLSEREQQLLDELERSLLGSPAERKSQKLAPANVSAKRVIAGSLIAVIGISVLLAGVMSQLMPLGVIGFVLMLGGVYLAVSTPATK